MQACARPSTRLTACADARIIYTEEVAHCACRELLADGVRCCCTNRDDRQARNQASLEHPQSRYINRYVRYVRYVRYCAQTTRNPPPKLILAEAVLGGSAQAEDRPWLDKLDCCSWLVRSFVSRNLILSQVDPLTRGQKSINANKLLQINTTRPCTRHLTGAHACAAVRHARRGDGCRKRAPCRTRRT